MTFQMWANFHFLKSWFEPSSITNLLIGLNKFNQNALRNPVCFPRIDEQCYRSWNLSKRSSHASPAGHKKNSPFQASSNRIVPQTGKELFFHCSKWDHGLSTRELNPRFGKKTSHKIFPSVANNSELLWAGSLPDCIVQLVRKQKVEHTQVMLGKRVNRCCFFKRSLSLVESFFYSWWSSVEINLKR